MSYNTGVYHKQGGGTLVMSGTPFSGIALGSVVLTNGGSATVGVGFAIRSAVGVAIGADGSFAGVGINTSLFDAGSAIFYGMVGSQTFGRGTVGYSIFG